MPNSSSSSSPERSKQEEFVLRTIEERNIRFIRLWFTDVLGFLKSVAIAPAELENAFDEGIGFDGSAIEGFARVTESDMLARPDSATFSILPWRTEAPGAARMFCDIAKPDQCQLMLVAISITPHLWLVMISAAKQLRC
jgi:glutamine synthetase